MHPDDALIAEAERINLRYVLEFVEAFGLCPWAERARREGHVKQRVVLSTASDLGPALEAVAELSADEAVQVGLMIFPRVRAGRPAFERFVAELRAADARRWPGGSPPMAMAAFHPEAEPDFDAPHRMVPFVRSAPDPTIQLVRCSILDEVRRPADRGTGYVDPTSLDLHALLETEPKPPLHERVAATNLDTFRRVGIDRALAVLEDIRRDRDRSYAVLGEETACSTR